MTNEQINAAITEVIDADPHWKCAKDYCTDLNAMNEAEELIEHSDLLEIYEELLYETSGRMYLCRSNARQRAEAFLRTLGKWENATIKKSLTVQK